MARCIQLAKNGLGTTYPNPLVGCVIVHEDRIIGEGWHYKAGFPHAEVRAIASVKDNSLLKDATLYVSLEPCSHFGKTPPCSDLIISKGIKNVVVGSIDPNEKVSGRGIKKLQDTGCKVIVGVLKRECDDLNKRFFTFHSKKRPYIFLKWAQTADGFIAPEKSTRKEIAPIWITNEFSRQLAHKMRAQEMGILVGTHTACEDNPSLTTRDWAGENPTRMVIDRNEILPLSQSIFNEAAKTIIFCEGNTKTKNNIQYETIDFSKDIAVQICQILYREGIQSLIVEGGAKTLQTFIDAHLWDEAIVFVGKKSFGSGVKAPTFEGVFESEEALSSDTVTTFKNPRH